MRWGIASTVVCASLCVTSLAASEPTWREVQTLTASMPARDARFGRALAMDGDTLVVGAPGIDDSDTGGKAFVFARAADGAWKETNVLQNEKPYGNGFGASVALRGGVMAIGAPRPITRQRVVIDGQFVVYENASGKWAMVADFGALHLGYPALPYASNALGTALATDGKTIVAGAPAGSPSSVVVFDKSAGSWAPVSVITDPSGKVIGSTVGLSGDFLATGAPPDNEVDVFSAPFGSPPVVVANPPAPCAKMSLFGAAIAVDGTTALFASRDFFAPSAIKPAQGSVAVYDLEAADGGAFTTVLTPPNMATCGAADDGGAGSDAGNIFGSAFGFAVDLRGDVAAIGAPGDAPDAGGAVHLYGRSSGTWTRVVPPLRADHLVSGDEFGTSVALSTDRTMLAVGAPAKSTVTANDGAVYIFRRALVEGDACTSGNACHSGLCIDGVCCKDVCGGGDPSDCVACSVNAGGSKNGECTPASNAVVCRRAANECDVDDHCDGVAGTCPADVTHPNGFACAEGACVAGQCKGGERATSAPAPLDERAIADCGCRSSARSGDARWIGGVLISALAAVVARRRRRRR